MDDATLWDQIHKKSYKEEERHSVYAEEKEKLFPRGAIVVELGSGTGADAIYFLRKGHSVFAMDISNFALNKLLEKAKKENLSERLTIKQVDFGLHNIPVEDNFSDVVYSRISLNYFGARQTTKIFFDIYRILKPGGAAYLSFRSPDDVNEMEFLETNSVVYEPNVFIEGNMLRSRFSVEQLRQMLTNAGISEFSVVPYQENLSVKGDEHHPILYVNDVYFKKV